MSNPISRTSKSSIKGSGIPVSTSQLRKDSESTVFTAQETTMDCAIPDVEEIIAAPTEIVIEPNTDDKMDTGAAVSDSAAPCTSITTDIPTAILSTSIKDASIVAPNAGQESTSSLNAEQHTDMPGSASSPYTKRTCLKRPISEESSATTAQCTANKMPYKGVQEDASTCDVEESGGTDTALQAVVAAVKWRRRSMVMSLQSPAAQRCQDTDNTTSSQLATADTQSAVTTSASANITTTDTAVSSSLAVRNSPAISRCRKSIARRRSGRRSVCAVVMPRLTIEEQVSRVSERGDGGEGSATPLSQLLDICIRESLTQLCQQAPDNREQLNHLKGAVMLNSEQLAEDAVSDLAQQNIGLKQLLEPYKPAAVATAAVLQENEKEKPLKSPLKHEKTPAVSSSDDQYKKWLVAEYEARTQRLHTEYKKWKQLKKDRREAHNLGKRKWAESRQGLLRLGEEQHSLLSPSQRSFLAAAPNYQQLGQSLIRAVEETVASAAACQRASTSITAARQACRAAADRAYSLTRATVYSGSQASLRSCLHDLQQSCSTDTVNDQLLSVS